MLLAIYPGIRISYYDPSVAQIAGAHKSDLDTIIRETDILSLHIPLMESTKNLLNEQTISQMKPGSYIINTSRGGVVDEKALYDALKREHLAGAALDVFEQEPYKGDLKDLDNCILTSHIGSLTKQVRAVMEQQVVEDVVSFFETKNLSRPLPGYDFSHKE
jgi:D-3-phosphoglycerate dehydrogenase